MLITCSGARRYEFALSICMLLVFLFLSVGKVRAADLNRELPLDIPEGTSLEQALLDLVPRVGLQLSVLTSSVAGHRTPRLEGTYTLASALATLLKESGLSYKITGKTLYVFPTPQLSEATRHRKRIVPNTTGGLTAPPMDEVKITTGTHIRDNSTPPGARTVGRADFDEANFQTLGEVVRSLPSSFPGGLNPGVSPAAGGSQNTASVSGASSANLFGMGSSSTLTLLNGQRIATAEASGAVDLTLLPISVVDRIDVLPGGASAVYGSDAVAGTVNVVLRTDYQGLEMKSALGRSVDGGGFLQHYSLIGGGAWDQGNSFAAVDCAWQRAIDSTQRSFLPTVIAGTTLLPGAQYCSTVLSATQDLPLGATASLLGVYTTRKSHGTENLSADAPGLTAADNSSVRQYATIATLRAPLGGDWSGILAATVSADNVDSPQPLSRNGAPFVYESDTFDNRLRSFEFDADGTLLQIPTGPLRMAAGAGYNDEDFLFTSIPAEQLSIAQRRRTRFVFGETLIPLFPWSDQSDQSSSSSSVPPTGSLTLNLAGRAAWYGDVGSTANPKIRLRYQAAHDFSIGASWGTSYRAPSIVQQYNISRATLKPVPDPTATGGSSLALFDFGGNAHLRPEVSNDRTLNLALMPQSLPGTLLEMTLFDIVDRKRVEYPTSNTGDPLSDANIAPFVIRNPSDTDIANMLAHSQLVNPTQGNYKNATVLIDDREHNITRQEARGIDLFAVYSRDTQIGRLRPFASLTWLNLQQQVTSASREVRLSGTVFNPPNLRSRFGLNWTDANYTASLFVNYTGSSRNPATLPPQRVGSWTTVDMTLGYTLPESGHWPNTRFTLSAQNLCDRRPPSVDTSQLGSPNLNYDSTNTGAVGTFVTLEVTLKR